MKNKNIKTKKFLSFLIAVVFMLSLMPLSFAADEVTLSGDGSADNPYLIGTEAELIAFREAVRTDAANNEKVSTICAKLTDDIELANAWRPIAASDRACHYAGTIDGDGHTISNMTSTFEAVQGLVGEAGAGLVIKNLTVEGVYNLNSNQSYTGGFVGRTHGAISLINCINKIDVTGKDRVSGFIGDGNYAHTFTNCANYGDITGTTNVNGFLATGGSVAVQYTNCANYGDIVGNTAGVVAGLSGNGTLINCIGYGSVTNSGPATATCNSWGNGTFSATNCFYREGAATGQVTPNAGTKKNASVFASGEVTYLLNGSSVENATWGQDLENDIYPVYGKTDYPVYYIADQELYSNKNEAVGTESNPYLIATETQLKAFRDLVNAGGTTLCAKLTDDITLTSAWSRMGAGSYKYSGTFDGNGYTIKGFSIVNGDVRGFVGEGGAGLVIKNLTLEGTMTGVNHSAAFIGRANGATTIDNCANKVNVSGTHTLGGFVGITSYAVEISNCKNYGDITATSSTATDSYTGAFIGRENTSASSVINSANYGDITGLTGVASGILYSGKVTNSYNAGTVSNVGGEAAPISHWAKNGVTNSYYIADKISGNTVLQTYGTAKPASAFSSGEVTYLLNGSTAENATWGQELGVDEYPVFGKTDYPVYKHDYIYSNSSEVFGTESNPYLIGTEAELIAFKDIVSKDAQSSENGVSKLCAKLTADIELTSVWPGIGSDSYRYGGIFDGAGYTISNLTGLETAWGFGLVSFGGEGLTFKNLTIDGSMTVKGQAAGFVGNVNSAVKFENCVNKVDITATADGQAAGFIGGASSATAYAHSFKNCVNYGNIIGTKVAAVAGFIGAFSAKANTFENCANFGTITGTGGAVLAGIASNGTLKNCVGYGAVINSNGPATTTCNKFGGTLTNCYYLENVTTSSNNVDGGTKMTKDDFASGKVAYLLNKNAMEIICGQDLTTDSYPMFGKDSNVYYNMGSYSNDTGVFLAANADNAVFMATEGAIAYVAQYASNGALINVETVEVTTELGNYNIIADENATNVKVFLWDANMKPLCEGEIITLPEDALVDFMVEVEEGRDISVLQLTDTQIIDSNQKRYPKRLGMSETNYWATDMIEERCLNYIGETVEATNPDLILLTGDIVYGEFDDNGSALLNLVEYMESLNIPWAPIMGNHENESKMGADWQCQVLENAENCLFKQRTLTGNGNYTVGVKQGDELKRVFFMLDSNGCGGMSEESKANGHMKAGFGFGNDQLEWYENMVKRVVKYSPDTKISVAFHGVPTFFKEAAEKYGFDGTNAPVDIDNHADKAESDFGYIGQNFSGGSWGDELYAISKEVGVDSMFVGHIHGNNASIVYDGIRLQFGNKTGTYDQNNYRKSDGTIAFSTTDAGFPLIGGTAMTVASADGAITDAYNYYCVNEY